MPSIDRDDPRAERSARVDANAAMSLATREVPPPPPPPPSAGGGYAETPNQERSIALLPGISLAGDAGPDGRQGSGFVEAVGDPTADDALSWHVQKIKERQKDVDGTEEDVKKRARATVETAAAAAAAAAATSAGDDDAENKKTEKADDTDDGAETIAAPFAFGPTHADIAIKHYRETPAPQTAETREGRPRKRKSRWEDADAASASASAAAGASALAPGSALALIGGGGAGGVPNAQAIKAHLAAIAARHGVQGEFSGSLGAAEGGPTPADSDDPEVVRSYAKYNDCCQRLNAGDFVDVRAEHERSPSPPPRYDKYGNRTNTRDMRMRDKLIEERSDLIGWLVTRCPHLFRPPQDWKPRKKTRKIYFPLKEYPGYNFIGLIIGPRGNTQKRMQRETNTRIAIRGKGSIKEGASREPGTDYNEDDDLHVVITGDTNEEVDRAAAMVESLMKPVNDDFNEHKRAQLRELALINGTLRDIDGAACRACGKPGHNEINCPEKDLGGFRADVALVTCKICGDGGHPTIDCPMRRSGAAGAAAAAEMSSEYQSFLSDLGVDKAPGGLGGGGLGPRPGLGLGGERPERVIDPSKCYVGSLPERLSNDEPAMREMFGRHGAIEKLDVIRNPDGTPKGFAFIKFGDADSAKRAIDALHRAPVDGRMIQVKIAGDKSNDRDRAGGAAGAGGGFNRPPGPPAIMAGINVPPAPPPSIMAGVNAPPPPPPGMGGGGGGGAGIPGPPGLPGMASVAQHRDRPPPGPPGPPMTAYGHHHPGGPPMHHQMHHPHHPQMMPPQQYGQPMTMHVPPPPGMGMGMGMAGGMGAAPPPPPPPPSNDAGIPPPPPPEMGGIPPPPPVDGTAGFPPGHAQGWGGVTQQVPPPPGMAQAPPPPPVDPEYERFKQEMDMEM